MGTGGFWWTFLLGQKWSCWASAPLCYPGLSGTLNYWKTWGLGLQGLFLLGRWGYFWWELLKNMFFAAGLGFSEEKAVKLRNAFSSCEIPFGFSWFIICLKKRVKQKTNPQHFPWCCWSAWGKKNTTNCVPKPPTATEALPLAGLCLVPYAAWVWG